MKNGYKMIDGPVFRLEDLPITIRCPFCNGSNIVRRDIGDDFQVTPCIHFSSVAWPGEGLLFPEMKDYRCLRFFGPAAMAEERDRK
jgi:hypothetical protein